MLVDVHRFPGQDVGCQTTSLGEETAMNADWIVAAFVIIDTLMERLEHRSHILAQVPDAEILTVAVVAAKFFQNHHGRALCVLGASGYLSGGVIALFPTQTC